MLDFENIREIGQGFAHEVFVVFRNNNPGKKIDFINANEQVSNMIARVQKN